MDQIELKADSRQLLGKKVRYLRRQGITPIHLYGHDTESLALQCETTQLQQILKQAGRTRLITLKIDKESTPRKLVVREVQKNPTTGELSHVDFYQVRMEEKIKVEIPIVFVGEAPALRGKGNMIVHELSRLEIECLPDRIPSTLDVDLSALAHDDQSIQVKDISLGEGISILEDPDQVIVRVAALPTEKVEEVPKAEEEVTTAEAEPTTEGASPQTKHGKGEQ